jgi:hypothetical protein
MGYSVSGGLPIATPIMETTMELLAQLYQRCSVECSRKGGCPEQTAALAVAASILGSVGTPAHQVRQAIMGLQIAFELDLEIAAG